MEKIKVIYINSLSASGSTLLDSLLGGHSQVFSLGEAETLAESLRDDHKCGCGEYMRNCEFWQVASASKDMESIFNHVGELRRPVGRIFRWVHFFSVLFGWTTSAMQDAINGYGEINARYFRIVTDAVKVRGGREVIWLVDASKSLRRLQWLRASGLFDIHVVHLVRDPVAFVHSMDKVYGSIKRGSPHATKSAVRLLKRWVVANALFMLFYWVTMGNRGVYRIHYEDLAVAPERVLLKLLSSLDLEYEKSMVAEYGDSETHAIGGNRMRWGERVIKLDEGWKAEMPGWRKAYVRVLSWPFAKAMKISRVASYPESAEAPTLGSGIAAADVLPAELARPLRTNSVG